MVAVIYETLNGTVLKSAQHLGGKIMEMTTVEHITAFIVATFVFMFGEFNNAMKFLLILQVVDFATGFLKAKRKQDISSGKLKEGAAAKFGGWIYILVGHGIDFSLGMTGIGIARSLVITYLTIMELTSIAENGEELSGVVVPQFISKYLYVTKKTLGATEITPMGKLENIDTSNMTVVRKRKRKRKDS